VHFKSRFFDRDLHVAISLIIWLTKKLYFPPTFDMLFTTPQNPLTSAREIYHLVCYESNISIFEQTKSDKWSYLKHTWYPCYLMSLNHLVTGEQCLIKTKTGRVNLAWNRPGSRTVAMVTAQQVPCCVLPGVHYWCQVWMASLKCFQRYFKFCDLSFYLMTSSIFEQQI